MIITLKDGKASATRWKSLTSIKRWATKYKHVWRMDGTTLIVSTADGTVHRYMSKP